MSSHVRIRPVIPQRNARIQIPTTSRAQCTMYTRTHARVRARNLPGAAALATFSARGQPAARQHRFIYSPEPLLFHRSCIGGLIYTHTQRPLKNN